MKARPNHEMALFPQSKWAELITMRENIDEESEIEGVQNFDLEEFFGEDIVRDESISMRSSKSINKKSTVNLIDNESREDLRLNPNEDDFEMIEIRPFAQFCKQKRKELPFNSE
ncbi:Hypothetical_protein [Hexamita inflata]|uniref:Hypothetical_protein n=1 Tax=Hexamita inflata TaxID=28002 RepID=A0AA86QSH8_9EUKA|nr:Hypothetical protein HINF_LOCUS51455 [Hexamita inflata]